MFLAMTVRTEDHTLVDLRQNAGKTPPPVGSIGDIDFLVIVHVMEVQTHGITFGTCGTARGLFV